MKEGLLAFYSHLNIGIEAGAWSVAMSPTAAVGSALFTPLCSSPSALFEQHAFLKTTQQSTWVDECARQSIPENILQTLVV